MPIFLYKGRDETGALKSGKRMAASPGLLSTQLIQEGISPTSITEEKMQNNLWTKLSKMMQPLPTTDELGMFARQMYTLTKTGVPLAGALRNLADNTKNQRMAQALYGIVEHLEAGQDLAASMQNYPDVFISMIISMVRVGQNSGRLSEAFLHINQHLESQAASQKSLSSAMRYPLFVIVTMVGAIIVINIFVIPAFAHVFEQANVELPLPTLIFIATSNFMLKYWSLLLVATIGIAVGVKYYLKSAKGRFKWDAFLLKIPIIGTILRRIIMLRFAQSFAITIASGVPLIEGIELVANSIENKYAQSKILLMRSAIERGKSLTQAAAATELFSGLELQMLNVSEETGELGAMLEQISSFYKREVEYDLKRLNDIVEPILILFLGIVVLVLALAVYLPIWNIAKAAKLG
jgi:MSHA biogenesis protein MshG